jgi:hypothetical protein
VYWVKGLGDEDAGVVDERADAPEPCMRTADSDTRFKFVNRLKGCASRPSTYVKMPP